MPRVSTPDEIDTERNQLSESEVDSLNAALERGFEDTRTLATEIVRQKLSEYKDEIMIGAEIAKAQFSQPLGGMNPTRGKFAMARPHSGYFGYDSWEGNLTGLSAGGTATWINDGAPDNLGGTDTSFGNPLKIGDEAVHVILGIGTYSPSPKISSFEYRVNQEPRSTVNCKYEWTQTDLGVKWLDSALILPENTQFEVQPYVDVAGDDAPYFHGVSFIESRASEINDPANMTDDSTDTSDNIVAKG